MVKSTAWKVGGAQPIRYFRNIFQIQSGTLFDAMKSKIVLEIMQLPDELPKVVEQGRVSSVVVQWMDSESQRPWIRSRLLQANITGCWPAGVLAPRDYAKYLVLVVE